VACLSMYCCGWYGLELDDFETASSNLRPLLRGGGAALAAARDHAVDEATAKRWRPLKDAALFFALFLILLCLVLTWWRRPTWPQSFIADNALWEGSYWDTLKGRASAMRLLLKNLRSGNSERVKELVQECCGREPEFHDCHEQLQAQGSGHIRTSLKSQRSDSFTSLPSLPASASEGCPLEQLGLGTMHYWPRNSGRAPPRTNDKDDPGPMWTPGDGSGLDMRVGPNYRKAKGKKSADSHLYECVSMDVLRANHKIEKVLPDVMPLPPLSHYSSSGSVMGPKWTPDCKLPRVICVNVQAPYRGVNPFGYPDPGCSIVSVYHITAETMLQLQGDSTAWSPALRLFTDFWQGQAGRLDNRKDPQERATFTAGIFKAVAYCTNLEECIEGMPMADTAAGFNGKPCLITKSGNLMKDPDGGEWMEISVDLRLFATLARTMLALQRERIAKASIHVGFLVQGVEDEDLPEGLIGDAIIHNVDLEKDPKWVQ